MDVNRSKRVLLDEIAAAALPETIDLWPAISQQVETRPTSWNTVITRSTWRFSVAVMVVLAAVLVVPPVRQTIADSIQYFGITETHDTVLPHQQTVPNATAVAESLPLLSLPEAQERVGFSIPTPSWVPSGMQLRGAFVGSDGS